MVIIFLKHLKLFMLHLENHLLSSFHIYLGSQDSFSLCCFPGVHKQQIQAENNSWRVAWCTAIGVTGQDSPSPCEALWGKVCFAGMLLLPSQTPLTTLASPDQHTPTISYLISPFKFSETTPKVIDFANTDTVKISKQKKMFQKAICTQLKQTWTTVKRYSFSNKAIAFLKNTLQEIFIVLRRVLIMI